MRSSTGLSAAAALLFALSPAAQAQVDVQTAEEIRRGIKVWIGQMALGMGEEIAIELDGQIAVTPAGDRYLVVLPAGRTILRGEGTLHFDPVEIDLTPMDNGWYQTTWQLPESYRFEPTYGSDILLTIGSQSGEGIVAPEYTAMMSMDAVLGDIEIRDTSQPSGLRVEQITSTVRTTAVSAGVYDTNQRIAAIGISGYENNRDFFTVESVTVDGVADAVRLAEYAEFYQRIQGLAADPNAQLNMVAEYLGSMPLPYAGFEGAMTISGVAVNDGADRFSMAEFTALMALDGLDGARAEFVLDTAANGVATTVDELTDLVPGESRFRLAIVDLPNEELTDVLRQALAGPGQTDPGMAMMMAAGDIQQAFSMAGTSLEIGPIRLASTIASVDLEGELRPELSSPYSVVGEIDMVATGLDALIAEIQRTGGDQDAVQALTLMQTLGAQAPDADGRSVRTYAFRLDAGGTLLLNGADIMPLISGMQ